MRPPRRLRHTLSNRQGFESSVISIIIWAVIAGVLLVAGVVGYAAVVPGVQNYAAKMSLSEVTVAQELYQGLYGNGTTYASQDELTGAGLYSGSDPSLLIHNQGTAYTAQLNSESGECFRYNSTTRATDGSCLTNYLQWLNKADPAAKPIPAAVVDTNVFRSRVASLRIAAAQTGLPINPTSLPVNPGDRYTATYWIKTDPNWNGTSNNSKLRIANQAGTLQQACSYAGIKNDWTQYTCNYTVPSGVTALRISFGNDGTLGSIWIDDLTMIKTN